ncbi:gamma carbonic anhydrase family protein [Pararhizobium mangrovi]|uniref:Gamma carbonic anhydrase family protein n=1 Tax=Pararhizobium mangrovi TaxID=2590452 RepID=A0A506TV25_9HYPH|nr:gamma carbonic anhydrase family protein [Pararhizobium mangrovi]TPW25923.1 gamma carbonic anhydrase family protein [Pararhizobium mangrovi]
MPCFALDGIEPVLPEGFTWIADTAVLIGKVVLEEGANIWFGAVLRGDNEPVTVGARTNIQENTVIHTDPGFPVTLGTGCTVGHRAIVHGCTVGDGTLIGMGAIVLNGARIGRNCLIGAGSLIPEGKEIPDGSLVVGTPGRVVRALDEAAIEGLRKSASGYVEKARRYSDGLRPIEED